MVIMFVVFETYVYEGVDCEMKIFGQFISRKVHSWTIKDLFSVITMLVDLIYTNTLVKLSDLGKLHF